MKDRLLKLRKLSQELRAHPDYVFADEATRQSIDDAIKSKIAQISGSEAGAFEKQAADIYAAEEKEIAETQKQQRADTNILQRYLGDVVGGIGRIGPALGKAAALGLSAIPGETGEDAARWLMEKSRDLEGKIDVLAPPPGFDFSSKSAAADTVVGNTLNMLPAMAASGGTSAAMQGGRVANAAAKLAHGGRASRLLSKLIDPQTLATVGIMSAPGVMESATGKDFVGRAELPENPAMVAALSVPHALIETAFGVTPMDAAKLFGSKSISRGLMDSVKRIRDKSGAEAAAKFFVKSVIKGGKDVGKTSFGEGSEEVLQGLIEIAAREFGNKDIPEAASSFMAEIGKPETWEDLGKNFVIGATVGMAISGGQKARDAIAKRITDLESQINNPKTTPEEAQQLAGMKTQLKEQLAALRERESALKSSVLDRIIEPAPLMLPDPDTALSTTGTMSDYEAYQQAKKQPPAQAEETFPTTPIGILNKYVELRNKPDTDPIKQAFMQTMKERGLVAPEQMQYPAGPEGKQLQALDLAELQPQPSQIAEATYEPPPLPMLPFNSGNKYLPDGSMVTESPTALPQITPPKAERITLKSGKPFANEKTAKAYQTKNKLQDSHQVKQIEGGFVLDPVKVRKVETAKLEPNAASVQIVDKTGRIPDYPVRKLTPKGDASRIEKKLPAPAKDATTAPEMSLATTKIVDWGTLRGRQQGKRAGGMVTGGMGDMTLQGKKEYTDYVGKLPKTEYDEVYATIGDNPFYLKMYAKARAENNSHDESLNLVVAAQSKPDSQTPANDVTPIPTVPKVTQEKPYVTSGPKSNISEQEDVTKESSYNRTLKNIEILRKEGVRPYIRITRRIDNRNVVYEAYTPEGKLLAASRKHSGPGSVEDKLSKRKDRYFSASIGSVEINKDDVFSMALFQQKQQEIDRQIQTYNGEAEQKPAEPVKQPAIKEPRPVETIQKEIASVEAAKKKVDEQQATPPSVKRERIAKLNKKLDPLYSELERAKADRLKTVETDRKSSESYKNATILRQSDIGDGYSFMAKIGDKYVMVSKNRDYYLIGNARNATKFVSRIEAESAVDTWNENQEWKAKQEQTAPKPALEVFKGDDITFQFPDGRTEGAYVQDATPKTIDGIADQIYVKLDANGALRYLPKSWITKVKPSLMRQNKMDLAATEAKREADTAKPEAWHTKLPETGKKTTGSTAEIINATSDDAFSALTADQKRAIMVGQDKFNLYVLPATNGNAGVIRFIPEDQKPANGWVQIPEFKETYRLGKMTEAQQKDLLTRAAWRAPILPAEQTRSSTAEKTKPEKTPAPKPAGKIEDFGEVLHGARKLYSQEFADSFAKSGDLAAQPLSKSWPEPDYQKLIDAGMNAADVSLLRALRDTLPVKPRNAWRVKSWLEIAKKHKALAEKIVSGEMESKDFHQDGKLSEFLEIKNLMSLYEAAGHSASLAGAKIRYGTYFYQNGVKLDTPVDGYEVLMPGKNSWGGIGVGFGKTMTEAIADFKKKLPAFLAQKGATAKQRTTQFSVYQKMRGEGVGTYFIAYKTGGKLVELKKGFATGKEAQDYRNANRAELEAILKGKRDVKPERRATNQPRVGKTRRTGDVTPQQFTDTFGFRGVQFGNWVEGDRRQVDLNEAYDALTDLADVLGIPPLALSLNGELGLAFGSRGKGGKNPAAAHYEPGMVVINLTKKRGAGSLAHEWWHALDNYFGKGTVRGMATESAAEYHDSRLIRGREEIKNAFWNLGKTIKNFTDMKKRGKLRDETRSKPYWSTDVEISARSFESFILSKLSDAQINNDYLANIVSEESYTASAEENDYPYLLKSEIPSVKDAFNALFQTMQSEKTDKGIKLYSVEHLVARYAAQGLKQAAKIVRAGLDIVRSGAKAFATWAREMSKQFGKAIHKHLKAMYADLQAFNKQLGKRGMIKMGSLGRPGFQTMRSVTAGSETAVRGDSDVVNDPGAVYLPVNHFYADSQFEYGQYLQNKYKNRNLDYILSDLATDQEAQRYYAIEYAEETDPAFRGYADDEIIYRGNRIVTDRAELRRIMARNREKFKQQQLDAYRELAERENVWYGWTSLGKRGGINPSIAVDGMKMLLDGAVKFADWSKAMLKKYAGLAGDALRRLYGKINQFLKMNRRGAILNPAWLLLKTAKAKRLVQQSDLVWKKDDYRNAHLEFIDPITGIGETVATVRKNAKGQWELIGSTRAFLSLKSARTAVKSSIYEQLKKAEKNTEFYKQRQRDKKGVADQYFNQPTAEEKRAAKEAAKPKTVGEKLTKAVKTIDRLFANERQALEDMQAEIEKKLGRPLHDWENVAEIWDTIDSRIEERGNEFKAEFLQPIEKALVSNKISYDDFNEFLYAMHAKERNDYIREINPEFRARKVDGSGMSEQEAEDIKARLFAKYGENTLMEIGRQFWGMHSKLLEIQEQYGLIDAETRKIIDGKYEYYTPLKRIVDEDQPFLLDQRATGRRSKAEHMLTFSEAAIDTTFGRGEHNKLYESIAGLMVSSPNPAMYEIDAGKVQARFNDKTGEVEYRLNKRGDGEKTFYVKLNGQLATITVHDQQLFNAIKSRKMADKGLIATLVQGSRKLLMPLKAAATAWNISFGPVNLLADTGLATTVAGTKYGGKFAWEQLKTIPKALKAAYQHARGIDNADTRMYQEFLLNGGKTGFNAMYDIADKASEIQKRIEQGIKGGPGYLKGALVGIKNLVSAYNDILESGTRFAGYMTMRESGASAQKSAAYAKNLTVNFNKYGEWGREMNALFAFANPGLQGSKKVIAEVLIPLSKSRKGKAAIGAMIALGAVQEILAAIMSDFDDDEGKSKYDKLDAGLKDTHFIVMRPGTDGRYASFRLPYGLNVLPALGRNAAAYMLGSQTMTQTLSNIIGAATGAFSPLGNDNRLGFQAIPTALKLPVDLWTNTKWTGKKIKQDQPVFGPKVPNYQRYYDNTNQQLVSFFKWLNDWDGDQYTPGTVNFSPADVQYIVEFYFSGVARDPIKLVDAATNLVAGETPELADLPLFRRFFGKVKDYNVQDEFREYVQIAGNVSKAKNANDRAWLQKNRYALEIEKALSNTNKQMKAIEARNLPTKEERERLTQEMKRFNKFAREKVQKNLSKN